MRSAFGLTLFGFDVIAVPYTLQAAAGSQQQEQMQGEQQAQEQCGEEDTAAAQGEQHGYHLAVIDVNYFPSYSSPGAAVHVWQAMLDRIVGHALERM